MQDCPALNNDTPREVALLMDESTIVKRKTHNLTWNFKSDFFLLTPKTSKNINLFNNFQGVNLGLYSGFNWNFPTVKEDVFFFIRFSQQNFCSSHGF